MQGTGKGLVYQSRDFNNRASHPDALALLIRPVIPATAELMTGACHAVKRLGINVALDTFVSERSLMVDGSIHLEKL